MFNSTKIKVLLLGKHLNRTPIYYQSIRTLLNKSGLHILFDYDDNIPDIIVFGFHIDINPSRNIIKKIKLKNPNVKLVVMSEEPIWDLTWHSEPYNINQIKKDTNIQYTYYNFFNSPLYCKLDIPYFILTESKYIARYIYLLKSHKILTVNKLINHWRTSEFLFSAIAEKRMDKRYDRISPCGKFVGLSYFRSLFCSSFLDKPNCQIEGKGWQKNVARQTLPDWHLDKISLLKGRTKFSLAMENVVCPNYITEKPFDSFSSLSIPVVSLEQKSTLGTFFDEKVFCYASYNDLPATTTFFDRFDISKEYAERYIEQLANLSSKLKNIEYIQSSRSKLAENIKNILFDEFKKK